MARLHLLLSEARYVGLLDPFGAESGSGTVKIDYLTKVRLVTLLQVHFIMLDCKQEGHHLS